MLTCRILWGLAGSLGIQPVVFVSVDHDRIDEAETLEQIAAVARKRRPRPVEVRVMGGNVEPLVSIEADEVHFNRKQTPAIVKWLISRLRADLECGERYEFEVVAHSPRTS